MEQRIVAVEFSEEEWQFLRRWAERTPGSTVQEEAREAVRFALYRSREERSRL